MKILAIETSCDETAVAVVQDGSNIISSALATSQEVHAETGGIIPENAARKQLEYMIPTLTSALNKAIEKENFKGSTGKEDNIKEYLKKEIDAIAVTAGPGLIGSLLVGVECAKTLALTFNKPLIPVNHVLAHVYASYLESDSPPQFPYLALIVSGGHSLFIEMRSHTEIKVIGETRDDAAGEAFDKCARLLGLKYPGGPEISKFASIERKQNPNVSFSFFPRPLSHDETTLDMSFSGLKTACARAINSNGSNFSKERIATEIEEAIVESLIFKAKLALIRHPQFKEIVLGGGVSANSRLQDLMQKRLSEVHLHIPKVSYTTDNAAMIGACAYYRNSPIDPLVLEASSSYPLV